FERRENVTHRPSFGTELYRPFVEPTCGPIQTAYARVPTDCHRDESIDGAFSDACLPSGDEPCAIVTTDFAQRSADDPADDANYDYRGGAVDRPALVDELEARVDGDVRFD